MIKLIAMGPRRCVLRPTALCSITVWLPIVRVLFCCEASAAEENLKQQFLSRYEPAAHRLAQFYSNVLVRARCTTDLCQEGKSQTYVYVYRANGRLLRLDEEGFVDSGTIARVADPLGKGFVVRRPAGALRFSLVHLQADYDARERLIRQFAPLPFDAYSVINMDFGEYLKLPGVRVTSVTSESRGPEMLTRLQFERDFNNGKQIGIFLFAPNDCWAIREGGLGPVHRPNSHRWQIVYQGKHDGVPLVHRLERSWLDKDGKPAGRVVVEVTELIPGPVPKEEFTLAAFDLSDAGLQATVPTWYYFQLVAVLALLAAVVFWRLSKRGRPVAPPPASAGA
jgi:hypothetical protein